MKVLHVITSLSRGGAEHMLYKLLGGLDRQRFDSHVLSLTAGGAYAKKIETLGIPLSTLGMKRGWPSLGSLSRLRRHLDKQRPDVVHCWMYHANIAGAIARRLSSLQAPLIWSIRHSINDLAEEKLTTRLAIRANVALASSPQCILFNSETSAREHFRLGFPERVSAVIPNGFDCSLLRHDPVTRARMRQLFGIADSDFVVANVARFHPMKDHGTLLEAAVKLLEMDPRYVFLLAGADVTQSNPFFASRVPEAYSGRIHLLGERDDVPDLFSAADAVCVTSAYGEAFPNVLGEAMAVGTPCIATNVGDSAQIIGDTGIVIPIRSASELVRAVMQLRSEPMDVARQRKTAARARIETEYSLAAVVRQHQSLYAQLGK